MYMEISHFLAESMDNSPRTLSVSIVVSLAFRSNGGKAGGCATALYSIHNSGSGTMG